MEEELQTRVAAFTAVCQADARWIPQYLAETERLDIPFVMLFDRCSDDLINSTMDHVNCIGSYTQSDPKFEFIEMLKQPLLDRICELGYDWAMAWDIDETYERDAPTKLELLDLDEYGYYDILDTPWKNLWDSPTQIRVDGSFSEGHRVKFYNLQKERRYHFDSPITNGAKLIGRDMDLAKFNLVCLHWGMMTHDLRVEHKERWDRIYSKAVGKNPYGFWKDALDPTITPTLIPNEYLP